MKNITVSVPDDVYRRARVWAARRGSSVSALVRDFLLGLTDRDFERRMKLQSDVVKTIKAFRAGDRVSRDQIHTRDALR